MKTLITGAAAVAAALMMAPTAFAGGHKSYTIGVSNTVQGNGWREQMICAMRAQALVEGDVSNLIVAHRNTDSAGQLEDLNNLIEAGVDAIVLNPSNPDALNSALEAAMAQDIVVVAVDAGVTADGAYILSNNQEEYAYLGAKWLFEKIGGSGDVVYMRGIAGVSADTDRDNGFKRALAEHPDVNVVHEVFTGWQQDQGKQQIFDFLATGVPFDGVWTSGIDNVIVDAFVESGAPLVPIVGADNAGFVQYLSEVDGLEGAAVTNPGSVGGAGIALAVDILNGEAPENKTVLVDPVLWENTTEEGRATIAGAQNPNLDPEWPVSVTIPGWTDYSMEEIIACEGPSEG
ncbi:MAG: ABC transporter substrate-binding protein [Silicimonas sp.]|nr:ABC transporter substrate-binding protein [Silicimonas sp.]NND22486.1 ABC transporter substrate-binding protein [Silicimonas sp.]NNF92512.1 ABC transporter substrate-binding protein [Boseongicola sp.]NNL74491.1 ABC transporter substrate-binding protein [Silicimonas sp.]RZW09489.1 MAG: sugar ABC transporter substrate-binding protein [Paracoccaceae bacterium]